ATTVVAPLVFKDNGYDPEKDFVPVAHVNDYEFGVAVGPAVPVRELTHLVAWLRANPNQANFGVPATGSLPHFFALMMGEKANVKAQVIGYRGSAPLISDVVGGQDPDTQRKFKDQKMTPVVATQAQSIAMLQKYRAQWAPVVQKSGYQP